MNDEERLGFAVRFSQMNFSTLRKGDLLNLSDDLYNFIAPPNIPPIESQHDEILDEANLEDLQKEVYQVLIALVKTREGASNITPQTGGLTLAGAAPTAWAVQMEFRMLPSVPPGTVHFIPIGTVRNMFFTRLFTLFLEEPTVSKILRCKASDCENIFFRKRKQKYCSTRCQSRDFMREFRKENEEKESEQNHKKYKKRVEKSRGRPTKIARRPRRKAQ